MVIETEDFAQEQKKFLQTCAKYLPGPDAKKAFEDYAHSALEDYHSNCPDCTFSQAAEQIGGEPYSAVQNFLESQPPEILNNWQVQFTKRQKCKFIIIAFFILVLISIIGLYFKTKGILFVNTKTTIIDYGDTDLSSEDLNELILSMVQKEGQRDG